MLLLHHLCSHFDNLLTFKKIFSKAIFIQRSLSEVSPSDVLKATSYSVRVTSFKYSLNAFSTHSRGKKKRRKKYPPCSCETVFAVQNYFLRSGTNYCHTLVSHVKPALCTCAVFSTWIVVSDYNY